MYLFRQRTFRQLVEFTFLGQIILFMLIQYCMHLSSNLCMKINKMKQVLSGWRQLAICFISAGGRNGFITLSRDWTHRIYTYVPSPDVCYESRILTLLFISAIMVVTALIFVLGMDLVKEVS